MSPVQASAATVVPYNLEVAHVPVAELDRFVQSRQVLTVMGFTDSLKLAGPVPAHGLAFDTFGAAPTAEVWHSSRPVTYQTVDGMAVACDGHTLMGIAVYEDTDTHLPARTQETYDRIFGACEQLGYPVLCRMWNYLPRINDADAFGMERYKAFCKGRAQAFFDDHRFGELFLPAGTGVGLRGGPVAVIFMARAGGTCINLENPRQMPAYHYPEQYGPKSPSFARGTYIGGHEHLVYVSGTSSILGHETVHPGDVVKQTQVSLENIAFLLSAENMQRYLPRGAAPLEALEQVKVYVRDAADLERVRAVCAPAFTPDTSVCYLGGDICRADLLVELEGLARLRDA